MVIVIGCVLDLCDYRLLLHVLRLFGFEDFVGI